MSLIGARVIELDDLRLQRKQLDSKIAKLQEKIIKEMDSQGLENLKINNRFVTIVRPMREVVDELGLRDEIDYETWEFISHRVFDKRRAEVALEDNILSIDTLMKYTHISPSSPYVKITGWGP